MQSVRFGYSFFGRILSYAKSVLFTDSKENNSIGLRPVDASQIALMKSHWVDQQHAVFTELNRLRDTGKLTYDELRKQLATLTSLLGPKLGSPALMAIELKRFCHSIRSGSLQALINQKLVELSVYMHIKPQAATAAFLSDVELLIKNFKLGYINSPAGQEWLSFYKEYLSIETYDHGLGKIDQHAVDCFAEEFLVVPSDGFSQVLAEEQIKQFQRWRKCQKKAPKKPIDPIVQEGIDASRMALVRSTKANKVTQARKDKNLIQKSLRIASEFIKAVSSRPWFTGSLIFLSRVGEIYAGQVDVMADFVGLNDARYLSVNDKTEETFGRRLSDAYSFGQQNGVRFTDPESWMLAFGGSGTDQVTGVAVNANGNVAVVGHTNSCGAGGEDAFIAQFNQTSLVWSRVFGGTEQDRFNDVEWASDDSIVAFGTTKSYPLPGASTSSWAAKISPNGELNWSKVYGSPSASFTEGKKITVFDTDKLCTVGVTGELGVPDRVLTTVIGNDGQIHQALEFGVPAVGVVPGDISVLADGSRIIVGSYGVSPSGPLIAKISTSSEVEWVRTFLHDTMKNFTASAPNTKENGGLVFVGTGEIELTGLSFGFIFQTENSSAPLSAKLVRYTGDRRGTRGQALLLQDGGTAIYGGSSYLRGRQADAMVFEVDLEDNTVEWFRTYGSVDGTDSIFSLSRHSDGKLLVAGSTAFGAGEEDFFMSSLSPDEFDLQLPSTGFVNDQFTESGFGIFLSDVGDLFTETNKTALSMNVTSSINQEDLAIVDVLDGEGQVSLLALSAIPNLASFIGVPEAAVMHQWEFSLPALYQHLPQQPDVRLDSGDAAWMSYDTLTRTLFGTPIATQSGPVLVRLHPKSVYSAGVGIIDFEPIELCLNVAQSGKDLGWLRVDSSNGTILAPVLTQVFNVSFALDLPSVLASDVYVASIFERGKSVLPEWLAYDADIGVLSGTPTGSVRGLYTIDVNLLNGPSKQQLSFTLNVVNSAPQYIGDTEFTRQIGRFSIPLSNFTDPEGDEVGSFSIDPLDNAAFAVHIDPVDGELYGITQSGDQGSYRFNLSASDSFNRGWQLIRLTISNRAPYEAYGFVAPIEPIARRLAPMSGPDRGLREVGRDAYLPNVPIARAGQPFQLSIGPRQYGDDDGDELTFSATAVNDGEFPAWLSFDGHRFYGVPAGSDRPSAQINLTIADNFGGQINSIVCINIFNTPPSLVGRPVSFNARISDLGTFSLKLPEVEDADGDSLSYGLSRLLPPWVMLDEERRQISITPSLGEVGDYLLEVHAWDSGGLAAVVLINIRLDQSLQDSDNNAFPLIAIILSVVSSLTLTVLAILNRQNKVSPDQSQHRDEVRRGREGNSGIATSPTAIHVNPHDQSHGVTGNGDSAAQQGRLALPVSPPAFHDIRGVPAGDRLGTAGSDGRQSPNGTLPSRHVSPPNGQPLPPDDSVSAIFHEQAGVPIHEREERSYQGVAPLPSNEPVASSVPPASGSRP